MSKLQLFNEISGWKKPLHILRAEIAKFYLKLLPQVQVIGITGSVGKTLTQRAAFSVLSQKFNVVAADDNLDPTFRIPKTILKLRPWHKFVVLEYGVEHPGDMDYYLSLARPNTVIVTKIAPTHIKYFGDISGVFDEKAKLVRALPKDDSAVLNADDPMVAKMAGYTKARIYWWGEKSKKGIRISNFSQDFSGSSFRISYARQRVSVKWKVVGRHQLLSAYAAAAVGILSGLTLKQIAKGLSMVNSPGHRLNMVASKRFKILDDTYNSSPVALAESINTLVELGKGMRKIAILGEMKDLGKLSVDAHETAGRKISKTRINFLITIGKTAEVIAREAKRADFRGKIFSVTNIGDAVQTLKNVANSKSLILVKGSRHAHLERVVLGILGKPTQIECYHCGLLN